MHSFNRTDWLQLVFGDLVMLSAALYATLLVRYIEVPSPDLFIVHLVPFALLSVAWIIVFTIAGLYERHTTMRRLQLPDVVVRAQVANVLLAAAFFFLIPYFGITPKTNLFIFLIISSALLVFWRLFLFPRFGFTRRDKAVLLGTGKELHELYDEINCNLRHRIEFLYTADLGRGGNPNDMQQHVLKHVAKDKVSMIVADMRDKQVELMLPLLYNLSFIQTRVEIIDVAELYEETFERIPLSFISHQWFIDNVTTRKHALYEAFKRTVDIAGALSLGALSLVFYPFVWLAIKLDDGGPLFITQERVGEAQRLIQIHKFRTMSGRDSDSGKAVLKSEKQVTRVGKFLRDSRIDELPQLWSVLIGDQSLIGPRPELPALVEVYSAKIPHYAARLIVKPGLSGWAQIHHQEHPHHEADIQETRTKLAYDLYYIKHRSIFLDILIALRTIQILLSRVGR